MLSPAGWGRNRLWRTGRVTREWRVGKAGRKVCFFDVPKRYPGVLHTPRALWYTVQRPGKEKACCIRHDHGPVLSGEIAMDNPEDNFCNTGDVDPACGNGDLQAIPDLNIRDGLWGL